MWTPSPAAQCAVNFVNCQNDSLDIDCTLWEGTPVYTAKCSQTGACQWQHTRPCWILYTGNTYLSSSSAWTLPPEVLWSVGSPSVTPSSIEPRQSKKHNASSLQLKRSRRTQMWLNLRNVYLYLFLPKTWSLNHADILSQKSVVIVVESKETPLLCSSSHEWL